MKKGRIALMLGGLTIGMAEFMPMGLLPNIATTLSEDIPTTRHLISAYAVGVVIGAPIVAAFAESLRLRISSARSHLPICCSQRHPVFRYCLRRGFFPTFLMEPFPAWEQSRSGGMYAMTGLDITAGAALWTRQ